MQTTNIDPYDFSKKEINGATVYYKNLPWSPCIHFSVAFCVGAFNDPIGKEGVAHFLEHMIGNGCPTVPDKKAMREFSKLYMLNTKNAMTSYNYTTYTGKCLPEHFRTVAKTMREYVFNPFIRATDVEDERGVITQEAWGRYKNDKLLSYFKEIDGVMFGGHERSRVRSPLGWPDTVAKISQDDLREFHTKNYVKENMAFIIVGAIDESHLAYLEEILSDIPSGKKSEIDNGVIGKPTQLRVEKNSEDIGDPKKQLEFSLMVATNKSHDENESIGGQAGDLLYDVLFERLRTENSLCYGVSVDWYSGKNHREGGITVKTDSEKLSLVEKEIWNVINEIIDGKWKDRFAIIHKVYIDQIRSAERTSDRILGNAFSDLVIFNKLKTLEERLENAGAVKYEDVVDFIKKFTDKEQVVTEVLFPSKK